MLITGATSGIGHALTLYAAKRGYRVIACGRNAEKLEKLSENPNIETCQFDVSDEAATNAALAGVSVDIAVLNAGTCEYVDDVNQIEPDMFRRVFEPNFFGVVNCTAALVPKLSPGAQILIVDSMARLFPFSRAQAYGASKAALHYFAKSLEVDLNGSGITVKTVSPGFVKTPLTDKNDFEMPMMISADEAAKALLDGVEHNSTSVYFPFVFGLILRFMSIIPASIQRALSVSMKKSNQDNHK